MVNIYIWAFAILIAHLTVDNLSVLFFLLKFAYGVISSPKGELRQDQWHFQSQITLKSYDESH